MGDCPALIVTSAHARYELPAAEQLAADQRVAAKLGQKKSPGAATGRELRIPVLRQSASQAEIPKPAAVPETGFAREFSGEDIAAAREHCPGIEIVPVRITGGERAVAAANFDIPRAVHNHGKGA